MWIPEVLRHSSAVRSAFAGLQERGIIRGALSFDQLKSEYLGKVLTLDMLLNRVDQA